MRILLLRSAQNRYKISSNQPQQLTKTTLTGEPIMPELITDSNLEEHNAAATEVILERTLRFLERC
jgi:hypothetical protein